jgi:hypothetical protein
MSQIVATAPLRLEHVRYPLAPTTGATLHPDWFAEAHRDGRSVVVSVTAADPRRALAQLSTSDDPLDDLFKDFVRSLTGLEVATLF